MRSSLKFLRLIGLLVLLVGCDQQAMIEKFTPKEESAFAKQLLSQLAAKDYAAVEKQLDPRLQGPASHAALEQITTFFPSEQPKSIGVVGAHTSTVNGVTSYNLTFEYEYPNVWLLNNVVLERRDGQLVLIGLHANPMKQSLKETNRFTFEGKGLIHYLVFSLAIVIPLFTIYALVRCFKTPIKKRKWLWLLFVALGVVQCSLNWTDGSFNIQPISVALLGSGVFWAGPYGPVIFDVAFPLGAIVFLFRRRSLMTQDAI